jgi:hypothetical protein
MISDETENISYSNGPINADGTDTDNVIYHLFVNDDIVSSHCSLDHMLMEMDEKATEITLQHMDKRVLLNREEKDNITITIYDPNSPTKYYRDEYILRVKTN